MPNRNKNKPTNLAKIHYITFLPSETQCKTKKASTISGSLHGKLKYTQIHCEHPNTLRNTQIHTQMSKNNNTKVLRERDRNFNPLGK